MRPRTPEQWLCVLRGRCGPSGRLAGRSCRSAWRSGSMKSDACSFPPGVGEVRARECPLPHSVSGAAIRRQLQSAQIAAACCAARRVRTIRFEIRFVRIYINSIRFELYIEIRLATSRYSSRVLGGPPSGSLVERTFGCLSTAPLAIRRWARVSRTEHRHPSERV